MKTLLNVVGFISIMILGASLFVILAVAGGFAHWIVGSALALFVMYLCLLKKKYIWFIPMIGGLLNLTAMGANNFMMPVQGLKSLDFSHTQITEDTKLKPLCDIYPLTVNGNVIASYSVGDVILFLIWPLTAVGYSVYKRKKYVKTGICVCNTQGGTLDGSSSS